MHYIHLQRSDKLVFFVPEFDFGIIIKNSLVERKQYLYCSTFKGSSIMDVNEDPRSFHRLVPSIEDRRLHDVNLRYIWNIFVAVARVKNAKK